MKKNLLSFANFSSTNVLTREQLKNVLGGDRQVNQKLPDNCNNFCSGDSCGGGECPKCVKNPNWDGNVCVK